MTRVRIRISTPRARAASATAYVVMWGSTWPSSGIHTPPCSDSGDANGMRSSTSLGPEELGVQPERAGATDRALEVAQRVLT